MYIQSWGMFDISSRVLRNVYFRPEKTSDNFMIRSRTKFCHIRSGNPLFCVEENSQNFRTSPAKSYLPFPSSLLSHVSSLQLPKYFLLGTLSCPLSDHENLNEPNHYESLEPQALYCFTDSSLLITHKCKIKSTSLSKCSLTEHLCGLVYKS